ncbi:hypothetical protein ACFL0Q_04280 [Thermodesulfobacteriota bacterium]
MGTLLIVLIADPSVLGYSKKTASSIFPNTNEKLTGIPTILVADITKPLIDLANGLRIVTIPSMQAQNSDSEYPATKKKEVGKQMISAAKRI